MRGFLFNIVASVFAFKIGVVNFIYGAVVSALDGVSCFLMRLIDNKRLDVYKKLIQQSGEGSDLERQSLELRLLVSAGQVRDHAKETEEWTDQHTEALNAIGDTLVGEMGWDEDSVHQYLKEVIESIDGLEYDPGEW